MAEITLIAEGMPDLVPMMNRSKGVHVSHLIHDLCLRMGHYEASDPEEQNADRYTRFGLGSALEHAIIERYLLTYPDRYARGWEMELDGLYATHDFLDMGDPSGDLVVHEMKLTWASSRHASDSTKFWRYWVQLKAYCKILGTTRGVLHVCFVNGDYRQNRSPVYKVWQAKWTQQEIDENWQMLVTHSRTAFNNKEKG